MLATIVGAFMVPVGFALSLESGAATPHVRYGATVPAAQTALVSAAVVHPIYPAAPQSSPAPVPEGAKLFAVGTVLVGLAAVARRAV